MSEQKLTEEQVREEYRQQRKDKTFAQCWPANNDSFYEWCSQYLDYQHITKKNRNLFKYNLVNIELSFCKFLIRRTYFYQPMLIL